MRVTVVDRSTHQQTLNNQIGDAFHSGDDLFQPDSPNWTVDRFKCLLVANIQFKNRLIKKRKHFTDARVALQLKRWNTGTTYPGTQLVAQMPDLRRQYRRNRGARSVPRYRKKSGYQSARSLRRACSTASDYLSGAGKSSGHAIAALSVNP